MTEPDQRPRPVPGPPTTPPPARSGQELGEALARLDALGAVPVHDHVPAFEEVDRALRGRLATAEG
ncbi:hypothetical protein NUM3379_00030 [Kineococcus sp. NUM-3379]